MPAGTKPKIAIGPASAPGWFAAAVTAGGGEVVPVEAAQGLIWADPYGVAGLQAALAAHSEIEWIQLPWAGVEDFVAAGVFDDDTRRWTSAKGAYAEPVAEHALALALALMRDLPTRVRATSWGAQSGRSLYDANVTILGGGGIANALLGLLEPFRAKVTVLRRQGPTTLADLPQALASADVVAVALALTPETTGIIDAAALEAMASHAVLVNVARGRHVVTDDLVAALRAGTIAGAGIDVTDPEPLPDGHPLWTLDNCIITPHSADTAEMIKPLLSARITENVRRYAAGEPLVGPVDPAAGY
jgi:phosphoglycerate dehydrogenase-like enzyme